MPTVSRTKRSKAPRFFINAATNGDLDTVLLALADPHFDVNAIDSSKWTALKRACEGGHVAIVDALLAVPGIDVNCPDRNGWSPLMSAAFNSRPEVVERLLLAPRIKVNLLNYFGIPALSLAIAAGDLASVKALLAYRDARGKGVDVNLRNVKSWTSLMSAAADGHLELTKILLSARGIDVFAKNRKGVTARAIALEHGHTAVADLLLCAELGETVITNATVTAVDVFSVGLAQVVNTLAPANHVPPPSTERDHRPAVDAGVAMPVCTHELVHQRELHLCTQTTSVSHLTNSVSDRTFVALEGSCDVDASRGSTGGDCAHSRDSTDGKPTSAVDTPPSLSIPHNTADSESSRK